MGGHVRNRGIYKLPDGTELIAKYLISGETGFYSHEAYENDGEAEYRLDENYNLLKHGKPTGLRLFDMKYTARDVW